MSGRLQAADAAILATTPEPPAAESSPAECRRDRGSSARGARSVRSFAARVVRIRIHSSRSLPPRHRRRPNRMRPNAAAPKRVRSRPAGSPRAIWTRCLNGRPPAPPPTSRSRLRQPRPRHVMPASSPRAIPARAKMQVRWSANPTAPKRISLVRRRKSRARAFEATAQVDEPALPATPTAEPEATAVQTSPIAALDEAARSQGADFRRAQRRRI